MSRYRRKAVHWPVALLVLAVVMCGRARNPSDNSAPVIAPEKALAEPPQASVPANHKPENGAEQRGGGPAPPAPVHPVSQRESRQLLLKVVGVHDGDTITGLDDTKTQLKIRLDAIDAPELGQPFGQASKKALSDMVFGKTVTVIEKTKDRYGRTVGHVIVDGKDVNLMMLEEGMAWHYKHYDHNARLARAEEEARAAKKGLWADRTPVPPWEYRKEHQHRKATVKQ